MLEILVGQILSCDGFPNAPHCATNMHMLHKGWCLKGNWDMEQQYWQSKHAKRVTITAWRGIWSNRSVVWAAVMALAAWTGPCHPGQAEGAGEIFWCDFIEVDSRRFRYGKQRPGVLSKRIPYTILTRVGWSISVILTYHDGTPLQLKFTTALESLWKQFPRCKAQP